MNTSLFMRLAALVRTRLPSLMVTAIALPSSALAATTYYVATNGNDSWDGLAPSWNGTNGPFLTLNKAKTAMENSSIIKTTTIRGGTYPLDGINLTFDWRDAGQTWIPYQNETPIIDGKTIVALGTGSNNLAAATVTHNGGYVLAQGANNLTIEGLTFHNLGDVGSHGESGMYINGLGYTIRWNTFKNCLYKCLTGSSVHFSVIDSNTFDTQYPGNNDTVAFYKAAYEMISLWYGSSNNKISHNLLRNAQGGGIVISNGRSDPASNNNIIDRNLLQNVGTSVGDMGALYLFDESAFSTGNQITNNKVLGGGNPVNSTHCIYIDGSASNVMIKGNICAHMGSAAARPYETTIFVHGGRNISIINNILEAQQVPTFTDIWGSANQNGGYLGGYQENTVKTDMLGNTFKNNIIFSRGAWPSTLWQVYSASNEPIIATNNYFSMNGSSISTWGYTDSNPFYENPYFANPLYNDYAVGSKSAVYTQINWQTLPTDQGPLANPFTSTADTTAPSVPAGLAGTAVSSTQINLTWNASIDPESPIAGYDIYRNGTKIATATTTSYSDNGLGASIAYSYTVNAFDAAGNISAQSSSVNVTTPAPAFAIGSRVKTTSSANVRSKPSTGAGSKILCAQPVGTLGTIASGSQTGSGYIWRNVTFDTGCSGWIVKDYLTTSLAFARSHRPPRHITSFLASFRSQTARLLT